MALRCEIRSGAYFDSVVLMRVAAQIAQRERIVACSLVMGTPANKGVLADAGLLTVEGEAARPNDLLIVLEGEEEALAEALSAANELLERRLVPTGEQVHEPLRPRALSQVDAGLALISTPGPYAAAEALKALRRGMSVFIFSDNVPLEQEVALKREAHARGLLVMGPDCGTAIIDGVPLGFANEVRRGEIALIGASGTGLQQVSTLLHRWGAGVSQAIGVGSRDLSAEVGAASMLDALDALDADSETSVIVLISKPPHPAVAAQVLERAAGAGKPVIAAFLGARGLRAERAVKLVNTLEDAARAALTAAGGCPPVRASASMSAPAAIEGKRRLLRGIYAGGTFAYEAEVLLAPRLGQIATDAPLVGPGRAPRLPAEHLVLDLGDDRFTVGRPHPMIDPAARLEMLAAAGADPRSAVIVLDVVLGHGAAADPAGDLAPAIGAISTREGAPTVLVFIVGTEQDPQGLARQEAALREAGAELAVSSTDAVRRIASMLVPEAVAL